MRILIVGLSTRAIAESAVQSGQRVVTLDYFGDRDQRMQVENYALLRDFALPFSAEALLQASKHLNFDAIVYVSSLENHPDIVEEWARERVLLGNAPAVLRQVRDWRVLRAACQAAPLPCPTTLFPGEEGEADPALRWLRKPILSGGGHGIQYWSGEALDKAHILQQYVEGQPASAAFVADGHRSIVIGLTEQLIGREELGAREFTWCGNILPLALLPDRWDALRKAVQQTADWLTQRFGLCGVNGMDLVVADAQDGHPPAFLVEVNPRYTASMELVERAYGLNIFSSHLQAISGRLPGFSLAEQPHGPYWGKGIIYARQTVTMPDTAVWMKAGRRDVPYPGERIEAGHPICTVLAEGETREACWGRLLTGVEGVRREIADAGGGQP